MRDELVAIAQDVATRLEARGQPGAAVAVLAVTGLAVARHDDRELSELGAALSRAALAAHRPERT